MTAIEKQDASNSLFAWKRFFTVAGIEFVVIEMVGISTVFIVSTIYMFYFVRNNPSMAGFRPSWNEVVQNAPASALSLMKVTGISVALHSLCMAWAFVRHREMRRYRVAISVSLFVAVVVLFLSVWAWVTFQPDLAMEFTKTFLILLLLVCPTAVIGAWTLVRVFRIIERPR